MPQASLSCWNLPMKNSFRIPQGRQRVLLAWSCGVTSGSSGVAVLWLPLERLTLIQNLWQRHETDEAASSCMKNLPVIPGNMNEAFGRREHNRASQRGQSNPKSHPQSSIARCKATTCSSFAKLMFQGKTHAALRLLTDKGKGGVLHLQDTINNGNSEQRKCPPLPPPPSPARQQLSNPSIPWHAQGSHPIIYDPINASSPLINNQG